MRPFPWRLLDATSRARSGQVRQMGRATLAVVDVAAARAKLEALTGERISLRLRSLEPERLGAAGQATQLHVAVVFALAAHDASDAPAATISVDAEPALAARLIAAVLGRAAPFGGQRPVVPAPSRVPEAEVAQAFAALLVAAARAGAPAPLTVLATGTVRSLVGTGHSLGPQLAAVYIVTVGDDVFLARLVMPRAHLERAASPVFDRARLAALGETPLTVPVIAAVSTIAPSELAALAVGDAWMPGSWTTTFASAASRITGRVLLAAASSEQGACAELTADGQLVLRGNVEPTPWTVPGTAPTPGAAAAPDRSESDEMNDEAPAALLDSLADAPVVIRVEIGIAELRAREWAELSPGDVVGLGRRVAEPVILRVAGREVARGELVDLDGEVGVRILSRLEVG